MGDITRALGINSLAVEKELGQARPADTNAVSLYSPPSNITSTQIKSVVVANTSSGSVDYRVFLDNDGTTYDQSTSLYYDVALAANTTIILKIDGMAMNNSSGNLAVRSSVANDLTFTAYGVEITHAIN